MELLPGITFTGKHFTGRVEVLAINEEHNVLWVRCTSRINGHCSQFTEHWDLQHVRWGIEQGEYTYAQFPNYPSAHFSGFTEKEKFIDECEKLDNQLYHKLREAGIEKAKTPDHDNVPDASGNPIFIRPTMDDFKDMYGRSKQLTHGHYDTIRTSVKIERNKPCPCGSKKKYKKCCLNK
jgi:hypothetical protein